MDDIYRSDESDATTSWVQTLIRTEIAKQAAFLATVTFVDGYNIEIARSSAEGVSDGQGYACVVGFTVSKGDVVLCQPVGGEPVVIGKVGNGEPLLQDVDVGILSVHGDFYVYGDILGPLDAIYLYGGPPLPSVLGSGTPQLGMYLEGNGSWSYPTITDGAFIRPGIQLANTTTATSPTASQAIAHYLGQTIKPVTQVTARTNIQTAFVAGTGGTIWAEVGIATSANPPTINTGNDLTLQGWTNVATIFNATGGQSVTISGMAIPAHSHVWILWASQGGTTGGVSYAPLAGLSDPTTTGLNLAKLATRISTLPAATNFGTFTGTANQAWWVAQFS
jgi:hypothetical protein